MRITLHLGACGVLLCTLLAGDVSAQQLPDIVGIRLGMPSREGYAALQARYPKAQLLTSALQLPTIDKPILIDYALGFSPVRSTDERIAVHVTPPPEKQVVWKVQRFLGRQKIYRANVLASLREKYGKETVGFCCGIPTPVRDVDKEAAEIWWIFDEQGRPGKFADAYNTAYACVQKFNRNPGAASTSFDAEGGGAWFGTSNIVPMEQDLQDAGWCNTSMIAVIADIGGEEIVTAFAVHAVHMPLAVHAARAEVLWLKDLANKEQQQQIEESKKAKPKL